MTNPGKSAIIYGESKMGPRKEEVAMIIALCVLIGIPLLYIVVAYLGTWK